MRHSNGITSIASTYSTSSSQCFSPASAHSSPPGYDLPHEVAFHSMFSTPAPEMHDKLHPARLPGHRSITPLPPTSLPQWLQEPGRSIQGTKHEGMIALPDHSLPCSQPSLLGHAMPEASYDWQTQQPVASMHSSHTQADQSDQQLQDCQGLFVANPTHPPTSSVVSPTATFAEAPASPTALAAMGPISSPRSSHRFSPYGNTPLSSMAEAHNPCSTGSNVARADSLGVRWSRCDEALQSGRSALMEAQSLKIHRAQAQKQSGVEHT